MLKCKMTTLQLNKDNTISIHLSKVYNNKESTTINVKTENDYTQGEMRSEKKSQGDSQGLGYFC